MIHGSKKIKDDVVWARQKERRGGDTDPYSDNGRNDLGTPGTTLPVRYPKHWDTMDWQRGGLRTTTLSFPFGRISIWCDDDLERVRRARPDIVGNHESAT